MPFSAEHPALNTPAIWLPRDLAPDRKAFQSAVFSCDFSLESPCEAGEIWISASQRFVLSLDGKVLDRGPSRSDPWRWNTRQVILPKLEAGTYRLEVQVIHYGSLAGCGQMGGPAFLLVASRNPLLAKLRTDSKAWRCRLEARHAVKEQVWMDRRIHVATGCGEELTASDPSALVWHNPVEVGPGQEEWGNLRLGCELQPDPLPKMDAVDGPFAAIHLVQGQGTIEGNSIFLQPGRDLRIVLDAGEPVIAYPWIRAQGGAGVCINMVSCEAPFKPGSKEKLHRDNWKDGDLCGLQDRFILDGSPSQRFQPLWLRSFRFWELRITELNTPLTLQVGLERSGFPLVDHSNLHSDDATFTTRIARLRSVGWRTLRLCSHETFFDCPHYEQAQFPGDSRIQALIHYLVAGEDRLGRKAIDDFHASRHPNGMLECRWPSSHSQLLPTYSLAWISLLNDFRLYRGDAHFLKPYLNGARAVIEWFLTRLAPDGLLARIGHAPFLDWSPGFAPYGNAPQDADGGSSIITSMLCTSCLQMAELERFAGLPSSAAIWKRHAKNLRQAVRKKCLKRGLIADTRTGIHTSVHAQVEAILAGILDAPAGIKALQKTVDRPGITQPGTYYYRQYLFQAYTDLGLAPRILADLPRWEKNLDKFGLMTYAESEGEHFRSDCHAWSVAPNLHLMTSILGIDSLADGFTLASFKPQLGELSHLAGQVQTPHGPIKAEVRREGDHLSATLESPVPVLLADGRRLEAGKHHEIL